MKSSIDLIIKDLFSDFRENVAQLTDSQNSLVKSMERYYRRNKKLSEKQFSVLLNLKKYL